MNLISRHWLLGAGLLAIIAGYVLLDGGRLSLGPLLLVAGYCVALPLHVWWMFRRGMGE